MSIILSQFNYIYLIITREEALIVQVKDKHTLFNSCSSFSSKRSDLSLAPPLLLLSTLVFLSFFSAAAGVTATLRLISSAFFNILAICNSRHSQVL